VEIRRAAVDRDILEQAWRYNLAITLSEQPHRSEVFKRSKTPEDYLLKLNWQTAHGVMMHDTLSFSNLADTHSSQ
jgi:hypothetical protein